MRQTRSCGRGSKPFGLNAMQQILVGIGLAIGLFIHSGHAALGEPIPLSVLSTFQSGVVTDLHDNHTIVEINHRSYKVSPDSVILDERGRRLEPPDLVVQAEVKFHVKKENSDKIDTMVVFFPR